jgi:hypothetical protein
MIVAAAGGDAMPAIRSAWPIRVLLVGVLFTTRESDAKERHLTVPTGQVAVVVKLDGEPLPPFEFIAPPPRAGEPRYRFQGIQHDVLPPGDHPEIVARDFHWELVPQVAVPPDSVGIVVRLFGAPLSRGRILADEDPQDEKDGILRKGILGKTLSPGIHSINPHAYRVMLGKRVSIGPAEVGVATRLVGASPAAQGNFVAGAGERGIQPQPLPPGSHYLNPFAYHVVAWSRESQRIDLTTPGRRVRFPTRDGFDIALNGTLEWSVPDEVAPALFAKFGELTRVVETLLMPATRAISLQHGVETAVADLIAGTRRVAFQNALQSDISRLVDREGVRVHAMTIAGLDPPAELAKIVQHREEAVLQRTQHLSEVDKTASYNQILGKQLEERREEEIAKATSAPRQTLAAARRRLDELAIEHASVRSRLASEAEQADLEAQAIRAKTAAEVAALERAVEERYGALASRIAAHGGGEPYARAFLLERLASRVAELEADLDGPLGAAFAVLRPFAVAPTDPSSIVEEVK